MFGGGRNTRVILMTLCLILGADSLWAVSPNGSVQLQGIIQSSQQSETRWPSYANRSSAPGDRIVYRVEISNQGNSPERNPVAYGPIPPGTKYVLGTATQDANLKVDYSIDGGKTFSASPSITILKKSGKVRTTLAPPERFTTLRWTWSLPLPVGATSSASYQVQVR